MKLAEKCNKCYIGQTKNVVSKRIRTHELSLNSLSYTRTALVTHCEERNGIQHKPDFDNVDVLETEQIEHRRLLLENLQIHNEDSYNIRTEEGDDISDSYCALLRMCKLTNERKKKMDTREKNINERTADANGNAQASI